LGCSYFFQSKPRLTVQTKHFVNLLGAASAWSQLDG
jgi:hypothetical protein